MKLIIRAITLLVAALIVSALGFTGVALGVAIVAKVWFGLFPVIALGLFILLILGIHSPASRTLVRKDLT